MLTSEKVATAAHLHVLLRRKTGRVTDTEWMAENTEYALAMVRFARAKAREDGHTDLAEWADKLERAMLEPDKPRKPLMQVSMAQLFKPQAELALPFAPSQSASPDASASQFGELSGFGASEFADSGRSLRRLREPPAPRYVGGIR